MTSLYNGARRLIHHAERLDRIAAQLRVSWQSLNPVVAGRVHSVGESQHIGPLVSTIERLERDINSVAQNIKRSLELDGR